MEVRIEPEFIPLVFDLKNDLPEGVTVFVPPLEMRRSLDSQDIALAVIWLSVGVPISIFANWLYDKLKHKPRTKIIINQREVHCDKGEIIRVIEEQIEIIE